MQSNISQKIASISLYVILGISVVLLAIFFYKTSVISLSDDAGFLEEIEAYGGILDAFLGWAYVLIAIAALAAFIPSIINLVMEPKSAIKAAISIVGIGVFVLIAYSLSDDTPLKLVGYDGKDNVPGTLEFADTMLFTMYFLLAGAVVAWIYSGVSKALK